MRKILSSRSVGKAVKQIRAAMGKKYKKNTDFYECREEENRSERKRGKLEEKY